MSKKLTPNFTWREATHSDDGKRLGLKNDPPGRRREVMTKTTGGYIAGLVAP